jgi:ABC-type multidrug transport system ATPase subunit
MLTMIGLTKYFGSYPAVQDLTFEVAPSQALALWGPNGAGKTTVIKCLLGLLRFQGTIRINGYDVAHASRQARKMLGYVPQELAFYDDLTVAETVEFFARLKKASLTGDQAVQPALARVGLDAHAGKLVGVLSGGMKQRLALALALIDDPPVLLLDEPTSNLDSAIRSQFLDLLDEIKATGKTILFTSHRLDEVEHLADEVLAMEQGRQRLCCSAADLAQTLGVRVRLKLHVASDLVLPAVDALAAGGYQAQPNGAGLWVMAAHGEKAQPIHLLAQAGIPVQDFDLE